YHGTGLYYCLTLDRFKGTSYNEYLVQSSLFVTAATYMSMIWETAFPFVVLNKRLRIPVLLYGVMMHLGIYVFMMINAFSLYYIVNYGFYFNDSELLKFKAACVNKMRMFRARRTVKQSSQFASPVEVSRA